MSELALKLIAQNRADKNTSLNLGNCDLDSIPPELNECVWLEELILSNRCWDEKTKQWLGNNNGGKVHVATEGRCLDAGAQHHTNIL